MTEIEMMKLAAMIALASNAINDCMSPWGKREAAWEALSEAVPNGDDLALAYARRQHEIAKVRRMQEERRPR